MSAFIYSAQQTSLSILKCVASVERPFLLAFHSKMYPSPGKTVSGVDIADHVHHRHYL
jgi:hypothetical protein